MKIYLATDHAGFELKNEIKKRLESDGFEVEDCGAHEYEASDDYPDFIRIAAQKVSRDHDSLGIIFGGSGQAENIVANKFRDVRSALFYTPSALKHAADVNGRESNDPYEMVRLARLHNNANVLSLGARFLTADEAFNAVKTFISTSFSEDERHRRRINKITEIENE